MKNTGRTCLEDVYCSKISPYFGTLSNRTIHLLLKISNLSQIGKHQSKSCLVWREMSAMFHTRSVISNDLIKISCLNFVDMF